MPLSWGDPAVPASIPIPCEVVHAGRGPSCSWHALSRFFEAARASLVMYLPLQLLIKMRRPSIGRLWKAMQDAIRSSAFLGSFISTFYYAICLFRNTLGPMMIRRSLITPQMVDSGLCIAAGCITCGWSILLEHPHRRSELAFFVAPRAIAVFLPREFNRAKVYP